MSEIAPPGFIPSIPDYEILNTANLILQANSIETQRNLSPESQLSLQRQIEDLIKAPGAWALISPFLEHDQEIVQFYGAHIAQIKIARDWNTVPDYDHPRLRDYILHLAGKWTAARRSKVVLRRLYVAIAGLALKMTAVSPPTWESWLVDAINKLTSYGISGESAYDFITIAVEEVHRALKLNNVQVDHALTEAAPMFISTFLGTVTSSSTSLSERSAALKCLQAWITWGLRGDHLTTIIPTLIALLSSPELFIEVSDVLQDVLSSSSLAHGYGSKTLTEPLLAWINQTGPQILQQSLQAGFHSDVSSSLCKLIVALGEHSNPWFASRLSTQPVQLFMNLVLGYTGFPGYGGVDEEESETTLSFWYLLQESLWEAEYPDNESQALEMGIAKNLFGEVVNTLRRKSTWPIEPSRWDSEQQEKFTIYRRNIGDTLINACYVLRESYLPSLVQVAIQQMDQAMKDSSWQDLEATLFCIKSAHEAISADANEELTSIFGEAVLGRMSAQCPVRLKRTMLVLIGEYCAWFSDKPATLLLRAVDHAATALSDPSLAFYAASTLQSLCDSNRLVLAPHVSAFGPLLNAVANMPADEKSKVLSSIASVVSGLSPPDAIEPLQALINPTLNGISSSFDLSLPPEDARLLCVAHIQCLAGCSEGLNATSEDTLEPVVPFNEAKILQTRDDPRLVQLRSNIVASIESVLERWSSDLETATAISDLIKGITAHPSEMTLITIPAPPLFAIVVNAVHKQVSATWLTLCTILLRQMRPHVSVENPNPELDTNNAELIRRLLPALMEPCLVLMQEAEYMESNPDVVQDFFGLCSTVSEDFTNLIYDLPPEVFSSLMSITVNALSLQERYSLVGSCKFLGSLLRQTFAKPALESQANALMALHGKNISHALIYGIASISPRSTLVNLSDVLYQLILRRTTEMRVWLNEILFSDEFDWRHPRADKASKETFIKSIIGSRSPVKTRLAIQTFQNVTRVEGTAYSTS